MSHPSANARRDQLIEMPYGMSCSAVSPQARPDELALGAAALAFAAGVVHLALIVPHLNDSALLAVLFLIAGAIEIGWSIAAIRVRSSALDRFGCLLLLSIVIGWLLSRTTGLPVEADAWKAEPFGLLDCLTSCCELLSACMLMRLRRGTAASAALLYGGLTLAVVLLLTLATLGHHALS